MVPAQRTTNYRNVIADQGAKVTAEERSEATRTQNSKRGPNRLLIKINLKF
jgi:hypothetical protein